MTGTFQVTTPEFAGPMDLLVLFVRRRELDVAYISVGAIITDYLHWLQHSELLELDSAGDFILLAAILLQFKAAGLLPTPEPEPSDVELPGRDGEHSHAELLAIRLGAARLAELEENQINLFDRGIVHLAGVEEQFTSDLLADVSLYDLAVVFRDLILRLPPEPTHLIEDIPFTIEGQMAFILSFFTQGKRVVFNRLADALESRLAVIMTFLAMLELIRQGLLRVSQPQPFGRLYLIKPE